MEFLHMNSMSAVSLPVVFFWRLFSSRWLIGSNKSYVYGEIAVVGGCLECAGALAVFFCRRVWLCCQWVLVTLFVRFFSLWGRFLLSVQGIFVGRVSASWRWSSVLVPQSVLLSCRRVFPLSSVRLCGLIYVGQLFDAFTKRFDVFCCGEVTVTHIHMV